MTLIKKIRELKPWILSRIWNILKKEKKDSKTKKGKEELEYDDECDDISTIDEAISKIKK